ncbi:hypothetical protein CERSUDRAFT_57388 [Gelatoporia subvermispora B]|uniref:Uncharacterized protein n=1 Tax=Ceriporiopsis subvermispora (strain B) TaxID=914234 RepID=M2R4S2_CERS8|nr:hypothetical protein CERSUDRAFT_57388 [Gelatoporia subvermispora B]
MQAELARWMVKNIGHTQSEEFLKLPIVQSRMQPSFRNKNQLFKAVDSLPSSGASWTCEEVTVTGDLMGDGDEPQTESVEIWFRDPLECVQELLNNPMFEEHMSYAPRKQYADAEGETRVIDEMASSDWWWQIQERLPAGATVAPVILSSDKTKLSQFRGDKSAHPVYLTLGNIAKDIRRKVSAHATILVGYLPVAKLDCFSDKARSVARYRLFHHCMSLMFRKLAEAGRKGVHMTCLDGLIRWIWPIIAAYITDFPEQCLVACCMENRCPICKVPADARGSGKSFSQRNQNETLQLLRDLESGSTDPATRAQFTEFGLRRVYPPFWHNLPHCNVALWFTPDLLHQLHKGVFKDHLVKWCTALIGEKELDARFHAMPDVMDMRHFGNGISGVSQWTGHEHKEMEQIFLGIMMGYEDERMVQTTRAVLDFIYLSSLQSHTEKTLDSLAAALHEFHTYKDVFIELGTRSQSHFNIPKIHSMIHYVSMIRLFGSADGFNTESPERLHIDYAKDAYHASNRRDYIIQMVTWLHRQETIDWFSLYLEWRSLQQAAPATASSDSEHPEGVNVTSSEKPAAKGRKCAHYPFATKAPRGFRHMEATRIVVEHHAPRFLDGVRSFLHSQSITGWNPREFDVFEMYHRLVVRLPKIPATGQDHLQNALRASPALPPKLRGQGQPEKFDFALVRTAEVNEATDGTPLQGSCDSPSLCVLFKLLEHLRRRALPAGKLLAYVEWFTPFQRRDTPSDMLVVTRSTRMHQRYSEVIEADRIVRNCYLWPKLGRSIIDSGWRQDNIVEGCDTFYFNPFVDMHMYCVVRIGHWGCT